MTPRRSRLLAWDGPLPEVGHYLKTRAGSVYVIIGFKDNNRPSRKSIGSLHLLKLDDRDDRDNIPDDAVIHDFRWVNR